MLTKTIGQLDSVLASYGTDKIEVEQSGVSKYASVNTVISGNAATTAQSLLATSNEVIMTPVQVREAFSSNNSAPVYACRAWVNFDATTVSSSISGTYTRASLTTQTVMVATAHGYITGNVAYVDFTSGGASDNSYIVTVTDADTFTVNTVSTSSILVSAFTLKRCPRAGSGNVGSVSYVTAGSLVINFSVAMPSTGYSISGMSSGTVQFTCRVVAVDNSAFNPTEYCARVMTVTAGDIGTSPAYASVAVFA